MSNYRYIFEPYKGRASRHECPNCNAKHSFVRFIDSTTGQQVADEVGKCNHKISCGYLLTPKQYFEKNGIEVPKTSQPVKKYEPPKMIYAHHRQNSQQIDLNQIHFTEIDEFAEGNQPEGILNHYSLTGLLQRLNSYKNNNDEAPAILKGIYQKGTAGRYCEIPAPFLPIDIDVKKKENTILQNPENNSKVFETLKRYAVMIWHSKSQKGIAGIVYAPELRYLDKTKTDLHLKKAKAIYQYLQMVIFKETGLFVILDWQQGKFRQIRKLAEQTEQRTINSNPALFYTDNTPEQSLISNTILQLFKKSLLPDKSINQIAEHNNLIKYLLGLFGAKQTAELISKYYLGTSKHWQGATVFWQIDKSHKIRNGKIILYNSETGKRVRSENVSWLHSVTETPELKQIQCLFGEHLLNGNSKPVAIVESEKTAMICSVYLPKFIWLATGSIEGLTLQRTEILKGRTVMLYPDLKAYDIWAKKAKQLGFEISDFLEKNSTEIQKQNEFDLADFLPHFTPPEPKDEPEPEPAQPVTNELILEPFNSYTKAEIISKVGTAEFQKLIDNKVIDYAPQLKSYYLYYSAPF